MTEPVASTAIKILVVCLGNHCRSPFAAAVLARRGGTAVDVRSAGLHPHRHVGLPAHPMMITTAERLGYDLTSHRGVALTPQLLAWADLILAMDHTILGQLQQRADATEHPKIRLYLPDADVPDPWEKTPADFPDCAALIDQGADQHLP